MKQNAQVTRVIPNGYVEIVVARQGACDHDCKTCKGCGTGELPVVTAVAENLIHANVGDMVVVQSNNSALLAIMAATYLMPMLFLITGYLVAQWAGLSSGYCVLISGVFFVLSVGIVYLIDKLVKRYQAISFQVVAAVQS